MGKKSLDKTKEEIRKSRAARGHKATSTNEKAKRRAARSKSTAAASRG